METPTIENQLHLDNAELIRRNALLEETLKEKEGMLESLKGSEKQYRRLFESAKDGILIIDADTGQEHLCYQAFNDPPDLETCTNCPAVKTFLDGAVHENTRQVLQNGVRRDYRTVSSPVRNASGKVMAVIEMVEDIDLVWPPEAGLKPIMMDPAQLDQSMANLCVNARDAISGIGKITVKTAMVSFDKAYCDDHEGFNPGDFILLTVSDNGCGMEKKIQKNIFEPFFTTTGNSRDYSPEVIN